MSELAIPVSVKGVISEVYYLLQWDTYTFMGKGDRQPPLFYKAVATEPAGSSIQNHVLLAP